MNCTFVTPHLNWNAAWPLLYTYKYKQYYINRSGASGAREEEGERGGERKKAREKGKEREKQEQKEGKKERGKATERELGRPYIRAPHPP